MIIGLTGPMGAGKDEAAKILRRHGVFVIDADELAHTLYSTQSPVWQELVKAFGSKILKRGGEINRKKLGKMVFLDKRKLAELNRIVHPCLKETIIDATEKRKNLKTEELIVINVAILKEIGLVDYVDEVWVVTASKEKRLKRLVKSGLSKKEALRRINAQASQKEYLEMADVVIGNDGSLKQLNAKVRACLRGDIVPSSPDPFSQREKGRRGIE